MSEMLSECVAKALFPLSEMLSECVAKALFSLSEVMSECVAKASPIEPDVGLRGWRHGAYQMEMTLRPYDNRVVMLMSCDAIPGELFGL